MAETPILDLKQDPPQTYDLTGALAGVAVLVVMIAPLFVRSSVNRWLWLPSIFAAISIHEFGHLAAAWLSGIEPGQLLSPAWGFAGGDRGGSGITIGVLLVAAFSCLDPRKALRNRRGFGW